MRSEWRSLYRIELIQIDIVVKSSIKPQKGIAPRYKIMDKLELESPIPCALCS